MAFGQSTMSDLAGAVSDIYAAKADRYKAQGAQFEKSNYLLAAGLADKNVAYTEQSTAIKQAQADREIYQSLSNTQAQVAGAGLKTSGSALDILADSAREGALAKQVLGYQGYITEEGYKEQAQSYRTMAEAADVATKAANEAAQGAEISAGIKGAASIATLFL